MRGCVRCDLTTPEKNLVPFKGIQKKKFFFYNNDCLQKLKSNEKTYNKDPTTIFVVTGET